MGVHKKVLTEEERNIYLKKFNRIIEIFNNNCLSNDEKVLMFLNIYSTINKYKTEYKYFLDKCGVYENVESDKIELENIYNKLLSYEKNGMIDNLKRVIKMENMINNYDYAEYIVYSYINMNNSYINNFFFNDMNIDENIFNYCVKIVKIVNPVLYQKYEDKRIENIEKRYNDRVKSLSEIAKGIKTGTLSDGTEFDILQFWKLIPFKYFHGLQMELHEYHKNVNSNIPLVPDASFYRNIRNLTDKMLPSEKDTITRYMNKNNIYSFKYITLNGIINEHKTTLSEKRVLPNGETIDVEYNKDDIIKVFKYMNYYKLPSLIQVYNEVKERYLNGEDITVPELKQHNEYEPLILDEIKEKQKENIKTLMKQK